MNHQEYELIIDVYTESKNKLIARLEKLKSTIQVRDNGQYGLCPEYSQIYILTTKNCEMLDDWLWRVKHNCHYIGVVPL
jgi:hypothetical protein